jgi:hypothetical protein
MSIESVLHGINYTTGEVTIIKKETDDSGALVKIETIIVYPGEYEKLASLVNDNMNAHIKDIAWTDDIVNTYNETQKTKDDKIAELEAMILELQNTVNELLG